MDFLERLLEKVDLLKSNVQESIPVKVAQQNSLNDNENILIVYGHNSAVQRNWVLIVIELQRWILILS